jgi:hypothetical protein
MDTSFCKLVELVSIHPPCMAFIMAMSMEEHLVTQIVVEMISIKMINLKDVLIFEVQFTPSAFSLLFLKESRFCLLHHWMSPKPLTPVQQVSIIRAGCFPHLDMPLNLGGTVSAEFCAFGC